jgi:Protein of unknown function (DUF2934)
LVLIFSINIFRRSAGHGLIKWDENISLGEFFMSRKHHSIYSDPTGAAAAGSPAKRRASRPKESVSETPSSKSVPGTASEAIDRQAIARLAYSYWVARGYTGGSAEEDWLRAEREIRTGRAAAAVA